MEWISIDEKLPTHIHSVLVRVVGGAFHHGSDFTDIGIYNPDKNQWQINAGEDDAVVEVSHWMLLPMPPQKDEEHY